jgi:hypothetical protein
MGSFNQLLFGCGMLYCFIQTYLISLLLKPEQYWRLIYIMNLFPICLQLYNFKYNFPYETPKYLVEKNRDEDAMILL